MIFSLAARAVARSEGEYPFMRCISLLALGWAKSGHGFKINKQARSVINILIAISYCILFVGARAKGPIKNLCIILCYFYLK